MLTEVPRDRKSEICGALRNRCREVGRVGRGVGGRRGRGVAVRGRGRFGVGGGLL